IYGLTGEIKRQANDCHALSTWQNQEYVQPVESIYSLMLNGHRYLQQSKMTTTELIVQELGALNEAEISYLGSLSHSRGRMWRTNSAHDFNSRDSALHADADAIANPCNVQNRAMAKLWYGNGRQFFSFSAD